MCGLLRRGSNPLNTDDPGYTDLSGWVDEGIPRVSHDRLLSPQTEYSCVDKDTTSFKGARANDNGFLFHTVEIGNHPCRALSTICMHWSRAVLHCLHKVILSERKNKPVLPRSTVDRGPRSNLSSQTVTGPRPCTNQDRDHRSDRRSDRGPQC